MVKFKYCLFDLDGTLTDPKEGITRSVQYALRSFGIEEPDLKKLEGFIGPPLKDSFREYYGFGEEQAAKAILAYRERFVPIGILENRIFPGVPAMLSNLKNREISLAVASSKPTNFVHRILSHFEIEQLFTVIVGSEMDGSRTAKEEVVEEALRCLLPEALFQKMTDSKHGEAYNRTREEYNRTKYSSVAMVGDRRFDVEGAKEYCITSIAVSYGYAAPGELDEAGADVIVETVKELGDVLR